MKRHRKRDHAALAPSASKRWLTCPGSFVASENVDSKVTEAALEGILAHEWAEKLRKACKDKDPNVYANMLLRLENEDEDMAYHIDNYIEFLDHLKETFHTEDFTDYEEYLEQKVSFTQNIWGTLDFACVRSKKVRRKKVYQAIIADLKYGRGVYVSAEDNTQLIIYLLCLEEYLEVRFEKAWAYIYQPRIPKDKPYEQLVLTRGYLEEWRRKIKAGENRCLGMKEGLLPLEYKAGDHCRFCPAQAIPWPNSSGCPTFRAHVQAGDLKLLDESNLPIIEKAPIEALVALSKRKKEIIHFLQNVDHYLLMEGLKKRNIGDLKIVEGQSHRKWNEDEAEVANSLKELGVQPWRKKLITIGAAEKLVGKKKIDHLTTKPPGKLQLALPEDLRPLAKLGRDSLALLD